MKRARVPLKPFEHTIETPKGPRRIIAQRVPLFDERGEVEHVISLIQDVTDVREREAEIRKHEAELQEVRKFLDLVIENAPAPIVVRNFKTGAYALINRAAEALMGQPRGEVIGKTPSEIYEPEQIERIREQDHQIASTNAPVFFDEHVFGTPAGERIVTAHRLPVFGDDGEIRYLLSLMTDVTERHRQTRELKDTKAFLDMVIENAPSPIMVRDFKTGRYALVNRATEQLLAKPRSEIVGKMPSDIYPPDQAKRINARDQRMARTKSPEVVDDHFMQTSVGERIVAAQRLPVLGDDGEIRYSLTFVSDVTERHHQTRELKETKAFLDMVIENVPVSILVKDARDLSCILVNRATEEFYGISRAKMIGTTARDLYPPDAAAQIDESDRAVLKGRKPVNIPEQQRVIAGRGERTICRHPPAGHGRRRRAALSDQRGSRPDRPPGGAEAHRASRASRPAHRPAEPHRLRRAFHRRARPRAHRERRACGHVHGSRPLQGDQRRVRPRRRRRAAVQGLKRPA